MEGFQVSKVIGDGNCLFRSVALLLNKQHQQLRQEVVQHVKSHWHYYQPFMLGIQRKVTKVIWEQMVYGEEKLNLML